MLILMAIIALPFACFSFMHLEIRFLPGIETADDYVVFNKGRAKPREFCISMDDRHAL